MTISSIAFEDISETDLTEIITAGVPEGALIDYKRDMYGNTDADVKEFLKDVSSFANTYGGHLIVGVDEAAGIPTRMAALSGDPDQDLQRLENLARDGIEPRIAGLRMKSVSINTGRLCNRFANSQKLESSAPRKRTKHKSSLWSQFGWRLRV